MTFARRAGTLALGLAVLAGCVEKKAPEASPAEAAAMAPPASAAPGTGEVLFGEVGSLTGQEATFGTSTHNGILLAVKEINDAGGLDVAGQKRKIRVITYDDQGKTTEAASATTKLIIQDRVHVIIGEVASSRSKAMAPIAQNNHVPMVSPSSTNPDVTRDKDYVFRVCFIDPFQGYVMSKFARETLKAERVAILRDVGNDYSVGLADVFAERFQGMGGKIVADEKYTAGDIDFKGALTKIRGADPQAIFVPGYYTDVGLIARQSRELGMKAPLLGGDGWDSSKLYEIGGEALNGSYFSNHYAVEDPNPRIQKFIADYKAAYGSVPDGLAALGYDAARISAEAITRAGSTEGAKVRDALAGTKDFQGVTGTITINQDRNAVKPAVVLEIDDGRGKYLTTISP